jgi:hypothetical protein
MKAKMIKKRDEWYNLYQDGIGIGSTFEELQGYKLSIRNCQAIEFGYDLEKLVDEYAEEYKFNERIGFRDGFKKALQLMGDKKFSENELRMLFAYGHQIGMNTVLAIQSQHSPQPMSKPDSDKLRDELIQSLQKNEWDVEIVMDEEKEFIFDPAMGISQVHYLDKPKLDADGCLILKRL